MLEIVNTQNVSLYHIFAAHFMFGYALEACISLEEAIKGIGFD
ncbi:hypothetical protein NEIFLAOT_02587 [Neisseria flavescens NRL30031/H210]|uniref:Uncharacterized protein n=1 Tax=Neisseria flavescens NRL30031/H210 TaxID=546264 RepID=C0ERI6_NEIFL|nr:hypothetical protein NEIFLAOT_02587 [Neisseria flavescens NRL30031/H210]